MNEKPFDIAKITQEAIGLDASLSALRREVPLVTPADDSLLLVRGTSPILLVAAHSVQHWRGATWKQREPYTAALAQQCAQYSGVSALILRAVLAEDANFDRTGYVKRELARSAVLLGTRLILDIHGADISRAFDIAIGTRQGTSLLGQNSLLTPLLQAFESAGLATTVIASGLFSAGNPRSICAFASTTLGIPALQIEINRDVRQPRVRPERYVALVESLSQALQNLTTLLHADTLKS